MTNLLLTFVTLLLIVALLIGQKPTEIKPCIKYGKPEAQVILVEDDKIIYVCGEKNGKENNGN